MNNLSKEYSAAYFLTPGECDSQQRMPITVLVDRIIEVATLHANTWNVGFSELAKSGQTWVLSRVTFEMHRYPRINEYYTLTTWIESYNKHFSERNFAICDVDGSVIGYARTIWVVIDTITRASVDISRFGYIADNISDRECPIAKQSRLRPLSEYEATHYRFRYTDIDFNRHVNSCRYIDVLLNQWPLDFHDNHRIARFEIAYMKEAYFGDEVEVRSHTDGNETMAEIINGNEALCRARFIFTDEHYQ